MRQGPDSQHAQHRPAPVGHPAMVRLPCAGARGNRRRTQPDPRRDRCSSWSRRHRGQASPATLRSPLPEALSADEIDRFLACLTATRYRDRAIAWLLKDGGLRISEALALRLDDINWSQRLLTVRASKNGTNRVVPISQDAITIVADYVRLERPLSLPHDAVFVNLGRRGFGQPFTYRYWVAICAKARVEAETPGIHAHAFRHTYATNMAEAGMPPGTPWVTLKRVLGLRHLDTLAIYNHVRDSRVQREYQGAMKVAETARSDGRRS